MRKIIFIRHGQDPDGYLGGWSTWGLTTEGVKQAKRAAQYLKQCDYQITNIFTSDLPRAAETAKIISDVLGRPVTSDTILREMNNGDLAGLPIAEAAEKYPGLFFNTLDMDGHYPNGESPKEFYCRVKGWFENFLRKNDGGNVLVVTHGGVLNIIYHIVKGKSWSNKNHSFPAANCSIHVLNIDTMKFEIENRTDFLTDSI